MKLKTLEEHLKAAGLKSYEHLQPGYDRQQVDTAVAGQGLNGLPEEIYELYGWHNGVDGLNDYGPELLSILGPGVIFYPIEYSVEIYTDAKRDLGANYFPLFGIGDVYNMTYFIDLKDRSICVYDSYDPHPLKIYPSLTAMIDAVVECFEKGAFFEEDGELEDQLPQAKDIRKRYGRGCEYWNN